MPLGHATGKGRPLVATRTAHGSDSLGEQAAQRTQLHLATLVSGVAGAAALLAPGLLIQTQGLEALITGNEEFGHTTCETSGGSGPLRLDCGGQVRQPRAGACGAGAVQAFAGARQLPALGGHKLLNEPARTLHAHALVEGWAVLEHPGDKHLSQITFTVIGRTGHAATLPSRSARRNRHRREGETVAEDPFYNSDTDSYRVIHSGHPSASAVTNTEGITVFFDPETHEVLGFTIAEFSKYYENHVTEDGEFEVVLPARVPANLEEEMDFDEETIKSNVRIAEIY